MPTSARRRATELTTLVVRGSAMAQALAEGGGAAAAALAGGVAAIIPVSARATPADLRAALLARCEEAQADLDALIAASCPFCGDAIIDAVAEPLPLFTVAGAASEAAAAAGSPSSKRARGARGRGDEELEDEEDPWAI
jgi:hypothetical protein